MPFFSPYASVRILGSIIMLRQARFFLLGENEWQKRFLP